MVIVTKEENALSNHKISLEGVSPCSHEEADTRFYVHAAQEGKSMLVKAGNPCHSNQCYANPSGDRSAAAVDCIWSRQGYEVESCT